jgi:hypothetical protein
LDKESKDVIGYLGALERNIVSLPPKVDGRPLVKNFGSPLRLTAELARTFHWNPTFDKN